MKTQKGPNLPKIVPLSKWKAAREKLLIKEKAATRAHDKLAAERRRQPMALVEKEYVFEAENGKATLLDLFEGRRQLILYHFMFAPGAGGWPNAGCDGCSLVIDHMGHPAHINARDTSFALISLGPLRNLLRYRKRMGWKFPWFSSAKSDFNYDFGLTSPDGKRETYGLSVFIRDGNNIYRTYFTDGRGVEALGSPWTLLDLTPLGRQETWEDSPPGYPQTPPFGWWRRHDQYESGNGKKPARKRRAK